MTRASKYILVLLLIAETAEAQPPVEAKKEIYKKANSALEELRRELAFLLKETREFHVDSELLFDAEVSSYRSLINQVFEDDISYFSDGEQVSKQNLFSRLKKLLQRVTISVTQRADILLKLQYLSFETAENGNYSQSLQYGAAFQKEFPGHKQLDKSLYLSGFALEEQNKKSDAAQYYGRIAREFPESALITEVNLRLGEYYFDQQLYQAALAHYESVRVQRNPRFQEKVLYKIGWTYFRLRDSIRAADSFFELANLFKDKGSRGAEALRKETHAFIAGMFAEAGGVDIATEYFKKRQAVEAQQDIYRMMGDYYVEHSQYDDAIRSYRFSMAVDPLNATNPETHKKIISVMMRLERRDDYFKEMKLFSQNFGINSKWYAAQERFPDKRSLARSEIETYDFKVVTYLHKKAQESRLRADYYTAALSYKDFILKNPGSIHREEANLRYAHTLYFTGLHDWSAQEYEYVFHKTNEREVKINSIYGMVRSYQNMLADVRTYNRSPAGTVEPLLDSKGALLAKRGLIAQELQLIGALEKMDKPDTPQPVMPLVFFKQGETFYKNNHFDDARKHFITVIDNYPKDPLAIEAAKLILESYRLQANWDKVEEWGKRLLAMQGAGGLATEGIQNLLSGTMFKKAEELERKGKYEEAIAEYQRLARERPNSSEAPKALYNAGVIADKIGQLALATRLFGQIPQKYPSNSISPLSLYTKALIQDGVFDVTNAKLTLEQLLRRYPQSTHTADAIYRLTLMAQALDRPAEAAGWLERHASVTKNKEDIRSSLLQAKELYEKAGRTADVARIHRLYMQRYPKDMDQNLLYYTKQFRDFLSSKSVARARTVASEAVQLFRKNQKVEITDESRKGIASMMIELIKPDFETYRRFHLQLPQAKLVKTLQSKTQMQQALLKRITDVVKVGDPEGSTRALAMIGDLYDNFAEEFLNPPIPRGLDDEEINLYKSELQKQAYPIQDQAQEYFQKAVDTGLENGVPALVVNEAKVKLAKYQPDTVLEPVDWTEPPALIRAPVAPLPSSLTAPAGTPVSMLMTEEPWR